MKLTFIKKARKVGNMLVISIPSDVIEAGDIEEGLFLEVQIKKLNKKDKTKKNKKVKPISKVLNGAVIKSLIDLYDVENELNDKRLREYMLKKDPDAVVVEVADIEEFWTTTTLIKSNIINKEYCDIESLGSNNIYIDISEILMKLGFIEKKRTSSGNKRLIDKNTLYKLAGRED